MINNKLPKMYSNIYIKFSSLRYGLGENWGLEEYDCDVVRKCRRVIDGASWKWQITDYHKNSSFDLTYKIDKLTLDEYRDELDFEVQ